MFGMGMTLTLKDFGEVFRQPKSVLRRTVPIYRHAPSCIRVG